MAFLPHASTSLPLTTLPPSHFVSVEMAFLPHASTSLPLTTRPPSHFVSHPHFHKPNSLFLVPRASPFPISIVKSSTLLSSSGRAKILAAASSTEPTEKASVQPTIKAADQPLLTVSGSIKTTATNRGKDFSQELTTLHGSTCIEPILNLSYACLYAAVGFVAVQIVLAVVFRGRCPCFSIFNVNEEIAKKRTAGEKEAPMKETAGEKEAPKDNEEAPEKKEEGENETPKDNEEAPEKKEEGENETPKNNKEAQ